MNTEKISNFYRVALTDPSDAMMQMQRDFTPDEAVTLISNVYMTTVTSVLGEKKPSRRRRGETITLVCASMEPPLRREVGWVLDAAYDESFLNKFAKTEHGAALQAQLMVFISAVLCTTICPSDEEFHGYIDRLVATTRFDHDR